MLGRDFQDRLGHHTALPDIQNRFRGGENRLNLLPADPSRAHLFQRVGRQLDLIFRPFQVCSTPVRNSRSLGQLLVIASAAASSSRVLWGWMTRSSQPRAAPWRMSCCSV